MKNIHLILLLLTILISCAEPKYEHIGQEIIDGKVSAFQDGSNGGYGITPSGPKIWVQTPTTTKEVEIPFVYENRWKVGDSCLLIIEKYKIIEDEK